jgi:hypothetical protein
VPFAGGEALPESFVVETQIFSAAVDLAETSADMAGRWSADYDQALLGGVGGARTRDQRITGRADASRCFFGDRLTHWGLRVGTELPSDGDGTMVGDKITTALAP